MFLSTFNYYTCSYIPVLMTQAKIYWDKEDYSQVEATFRKSVEFCSEHDVWKLNVAHVLFMQVRILILLVAETSVIHVLTCI